MDSENHSHEIYKPSYNIQRPQLFCVGINTFKRDDRVGELSSEATAESAGSVASDATSGESSEGGVKLSFEEQMVMAMALSITDAPTTRVRSGPLVGH